MHSPDYSLAVSSGPVSRRALRWLMLGVAALGLAGVFAGLLANTKSPYFYTALVVHVDLSVLVWFLTIACMLFTLAGKGRGSDVVEDAAFYSMTLGTLFIALSAFTGGEPYMSNYIPVIHHPVFFLGLGLVGCGSSLAAGNLLSACAARDGAASFGVALAAFVLLLALLCFTWSQRELPTDLHGQIYYEYAFWSGGHVLQFMHTQLMLVAWVWLAQASGIRMRLSGRMLRIIYLLGPIVTLASVMIYLRYDVMSDGFRNGFTLSMRHANGLAALVAGGIIIASAVRSNSFSHGDLGARLMPMLGKPSASGRGLGEGPKVPVSHIVPHPDLLPEGEGIAATARLARITLYMSILLFFAGGMLGYMIAGSNVTVPAHYHGSIVGVTLAFMGAAYLLMPAFGYDHLVRSRLARIQPVLYGGGQLCWMTGMAILGAHGVPRKTPGSADTVGALASFLKHGGDGLALIGGLLFVFLMLRAVWKGKK